MGTQTLCCCLSLDLHNTWWEFGENIKFFTQNTCYFFRWNFSSFSSHSHRCLRGSRCRLDCALFQPVSLLSWDLRVLDTPICDNMVPFHVELCVYTLGCRFHYYIEVKLKMFVLSTHLHCHQKCCVASGLGPEDAYQVLRPCVRSLLRYSLTSCLASSLADSLSHYGQTNWSIQNSFEIV